MSAIRVKPLSITRRKQLFWALAALLLALAALGLWYIRSAYRTGSLILPPCLFHAITGLHCAGCGMTRALYHIMNGELYQGFRMNPLAVLSALPLLWITAVALYRSMLGRAMPRLPTWLPWVALAVIVLYTVARNLPWEPFSWLAPTQLSWQAQ